MKYLRRIITFISLTLPSAVLLAQATNTKGDGPLVPECGEYQLCGGAGEEEGWTQLFQLFTNILNWFIWISVPIAAVTIAYAGWLLIWGAEKPGSRAEAYKILKSAFIGLATVLAAALIVKSVLGALGGDANYQNFIQ